MKTQKVLSSLLGNSSGMNKADIRMILDGTDGWGPTRVGSLMSNFEKIQKGF